MTTVRFAGIPEIQRNLIKGALYLGESQRNQYSADILRPGDRTARDSYIGYNGLARGHLAAAVYDAEFPRYLELCEKPENDRRLNEEPLTVQLGQFGGTYHLSLKEIFEPKYQMAVYHASSEKVKEVGTRQFKREFIDWLKTMVESASYKLETGNIDKVPQMLQQINGAFTKTLDQDP